jgi:DNA-binding NarL/FixJ family response regulator
MNDANTSGAVRVAIIDNDRLVPAGLRALLAGTEDIRVVHTATNLQDYLDAAAVTASSGHPFADVVLLDLQLGDGSVPAANVTALRATGSRVLVLSVHGDRRHIRATMRAGACGYLIKDDDVDQLADAIRTIYSGQIALTTELMSIIGDNPPELSTQERQALFLYGTGSTLAATARRMGVAIPTVRTYLNRIRAKWAAMDEPLDDIRDLVHEYNHE